MFRRRNYKFILLLFYVHFSSSILFLDESEQIFYQTMPGVLEQVMSRLKIYNEINIIVGDNLNVLLPKYLLFYTISDQDDESVSYSKGKITVIFTQSSPIYYIKKYSKIPKQTKDFVFYSRRCISGADVPYLLRKGWENNILILSIITQCGNATDVYLFEKRMLSKVCKYGLQMEAYTLHPIHFKNSTIHFVDMGIPNFCNLKVIWFDATPFVIDVDKGTGIQVKTLEAVQKACKANFKYETKEKFQHEFSTNGTYHYLIEDLATGKADIGLGRLMMNDTRTVPCRLGPVFYNDYTYFVGPKPKILMTYTKLLTVFQKETWLRIAYTIISVIVTFYILVKVLNIKEYGLVKVVFDTCCMAIGSGLSHSSDKITFRILMIFYLLFCLNMDGIYLGKLSSIFTSRSYGAKVDSYVQIALQQHRINLTMHMERLTLIRFVIKDDPLASSWVFLRNDSDDDLLRYVAYTQHNVTVSFKSTLEYNPYEHSLTDLFDVVSVYLSLFETFYVSRFTILGDTVITWAHDIVEKGFLVKWYDDIILDRSVLWPPYEEEDEKVVLTLAHYRELCVIYMYGSLAAMALFILEFLAKWIEVNTRFLERVDFLIGLLKPPEM